MTDSASFTSSFSYGFSYDVFVSFRGSDTRYGFTGNLCKALRDRGIHTFIDEDELEKGEEISLSLVNAIEESRIAIPIFSNNYAFSSFCLDELVYIVECVKDKGRLVLPVFYGVDPSHVRQVTGSYAEALAMHEARFSTEKINRWKMALVQAANLSGYHFKLGNEYEYEFIEKIVKEVSKKINRTPLYVADYPVGMESRVLQVKLLLDIGCDDGVRIVGIYGIGGMGKTTLARAVYNSIADRFESLCFLDDVKEKSTKYGLVHLQETFLSEIVGEKDIKIGSVYKGISIIKHRLHRKKILLILDDVDKLEQLRAIVGWPTWFGSGSRVIITTRDKHLLASHGVERKYEVDDLNEEEALELLTWNAFKNERVDPNYKDILNQAVAYASGLPLALEVVGSLLFGKSVKEWESALDLYKKIPNKRIQDILMVSYNALEEDHQKIFLDIACCFKGYELGEAEDILCAHYGACMKYSIGVLVDRSLIKIKKNGSVTMHDLIEVMAKEIDRQESPKELGKRRRLWFYKDIVQVLAENTGTSEIEIIHLDFPPHKEDEEILVEWDGDAFKKMENLKTLIIRKCRFSKGPKHLPNSLRVLEWWILQDFPSDFHPKKLAICNLPRSFFTSLELAGLFKKFMNLKVLNFDGTECLTQIPDVSSLHNLEKLSFECCENLVTIHSSIGFLEKLRILSASGCNKLKCFPPINLTSLEQLELSSCSSLESFPEILGKMENITRLELKFTPIKVLPFSFGNLTRLQDLALVDCGYVQLPNSIVTLTELAELFAMECKGCLLPKQGDSEEKVGSSTSSNVECLCLSGCNLSDEYFPILFSWFANVRELELSSNNFTFLPERIAECRSLALLNLDNCVHLREIRGIPPNLEYFSAGNCISLTSRSTTMLLPQELHEGGNTMFCLPGARIPNWFKHHSAEPSISFWFRHKFPSMVLCFVIGPMGKDSILFRPIVTINGNTRKIKKLNGKRICFDFPALTDHILIFGTRYIRFEDDLDKKVRSENNEWNHVVVSIGIDFEPTLEEMGVKQTGLHLIKPKCNMDDIRFTDPYNNQLFLKEKHRLVCIGDPISPGHGQLMQQQTALASLGPHVRHDKESLSLLPPSEFSNDLNWNSKSTSSITSVQGHEIVSRKRKIGTLRLDTEILQFVQQRKQLALSDLLQRRGRERLLLHLTPAWKLFDDEMICDSKSLTSCITSVHSCEGIHEAKGKEMVKCKLSDRDDNLSGSLMEQQPVTKRAAFVAPNSSMEVIQSNERICDSKSTTSCITSVHCSEGVYEAKGKEMVKCKLSDGDDIGSISIVEQQPVTKDFWLWLKR